MTPGVDDGTVFHDAADDCCHFLVGCRSLIVVSVLEAIQDGFQHAITDVEMIHIGKKFLLFLLLGLGRLTEDVEAALTGEGNQFSTHVSQHVFKSAQVDLALQTICLECPGKNAHRVFEWEKGGDHEIDVKASFQGAVGCNLEEADVQVVGLFFTEEAKNAGSGGRAVGQMGNACGSKISFGTGDTQERTDIVKTGE